MCLTWKMQQLYANIVRGKVGCWFSRGGCLKSGTGFIDDYTLIGYPPYQKISILCPSTILPYWHHFENYLATKAFIIKSYWTHQQSPGKEAPCLLYKKQDPSTLSWNQKRRALSKHSGNAPVAKRWTNQVLPLKGLPITRIPACQSGSSAPSRGTNGKRMAKRHKYGT